MSHASEQLTARKETCRIDLDSTIELGIPIGECIECGLREIESIVGVIDRRHQNGYTLESEIPAGAAIG